VASADHRLIPAGIRDNSTLAFNDLINRLGLVPLDQLLINLVDNVSSTAMHHLIEQFHVTGWEGGAQALTDADRRALIKRAIALHRYKGTPWAVKQALAATGQRVLLTEWFNQTPAGSPYTALADVEVTDRPIDLASITAIEAAIEEWKSYRSHITVRVLATTRGSIYHAAACFSGDETTIYPYNVTELTAQPLPACTIGIGVHSWLETEVTPA
jgi:phage tail P2-like protein